MLIVFRYYLIIDTTPNDTTSGKKQKKSYLVALWIAERQGFEPWVPARVQRFSRPPRSTTPAPFLFLQRSAVCVCKVTNYF